MHLSKEEILKLSLTSQDLLEICTRVKYKSPISFGLKLRSKIFLSRLKIKVRSRGQYVRHHHKRYCYKEYQSPAVSFGSKQKRSTDGCPNFKGPETRQVQERLVSIYFLDRRTDGPADRHGNSYIPSQTKIKYGFAFPYQLCPFRQNTYFYDLSVHFHVK